MSLLLLERRQRCPLSFYFQGQSLEVIDHKGQPWFTAEMIGRALGYAKPKDAILKIFGRNKAEFGPDETTIIEMEVEINSGDYRPQNGDGSRDENVDYHPQTGGGSLEKSDDYRSQADYGSQDKLAKHTRKIQVRIFSLRGAYHFGFFAKTELGRQYRQWVLDLIEARHEETSYYAAFRDVVGVLTDKYPLWPQVHFKLSVGEPLTHIAQHLNIPVSRVSRAVRQMRHYKVLTEKDYQRYRADSRDYLKIVNQVRKQRDALL